MSEEVQPYETLETVECLGGTFYIKRAPNGTICGIFIYKQREGVYSDRYPSGQGSIWYSKEAWLRLLRRGVKIELMSREEATRVAAVINTSDLPEAWTEMDSDHDFITFEAGINNMPEGAVA